MLLDVPVMAGQPRSRDLLYALWAPPGRAAAMILSLSLDNDALYRGLDIAVEAGKRNLRSSPEDAIAVIAANLAAMDVDHDEVVLTGAMAIWAYLTVFHALHGRTRRIWYEDGLGRRILVAAHG